MDTTQRPRALQRQRSASARGDWPFRDVGITSFEPRISSHFGVLSLQFGLYYCQPLRALNEGGRLEIAISLRLLEEREA